MKKICAAEPSLVVPQIDTIPLPPPFLEPIPPETSSSASSCESVNRDLREVERTAKLVNDDAKQQLLAAIQRRSGPANAAATPQNPKQDRRPGVRRTGVTGKSPLRSWRMTGGRLDC